MKRILVFVSIFFLFGCSFSKDGTARNSLSPEMSKSAMYQRLKELIKHKSLREIIESEELKFNGLADDQKVMLFEIAVGRGDQEVFSVLLKRGFFESVFLNGYFIKSQKKMNLDIRAAVNTYLSSDVVSLVSAIKSNPKALKIAIDQKLRTCSGIWSQVLFLRWGDSELLRDSEKIILSSIADAKCRSLDKNLGSYFFRNELSFLYLRKLNSFLVLNELLDSFSSSSSKYLAGKYPGGTLLISPLMILSRLPHEAQAEDKRRVILKIQDDLFGREDVAYYLISRSGAYRYGSFSRPTDIVLLDEHLIDQVVDENADFVFEKYVPVDQDIRVP